MPKARVPKLVGLLILVGCSQRAAPASTADGGTDEHAAHKTGLGSVMVQVARRFEIAGRAALANRYELAEFEAGEIEELFESDVPNAELPKEGPTAQIPVMAKAFLQTSAPDLKKAAAAKDRAAFELAFRNVSAACNACHKASEKEFIQVPSELGKAVPDLDPVPTVAPPH